MASSSMVMELNNCVALSTGLQGSCNCSITKQAIKQGPATAELLNRPSIEDIQVQDAEWVIIEDIEGKLQRLC